MLVAAACGGSDGGSATRSTGPGTAPQTGGLVITVAGLPSGIGASVSVRGPDGATRTVPSSSTLTGLQTGTYEIAAADVDARDDRFHGNPSSQSVTVTAGSSVPVAVDYTIITGSLIISASGLPEGATPQVAISGPQDFARSVAVGTTLAGLAPGRYRLNAAPMSVGDHTYAPIAEPTEITVSPSITPVPVSIPYQVASGAMLVSFGGLPAGASGSAQVTGPGDFRRTVSSGTLISNLVPGNYTVIGSPVSAGSETYRVLAPLTVAVSASTTPASVPVQYVHASARLTVSITGVPAGVDAAVTVSGPDGFVRELQKTETLTSLVPGSYTVAARNVVAIASYAPSPATRSVQLAASSSPVSVSVAYAVVTGRLAVTVTGLPANTPASITVSGPSDFSRTLTSTETLSGLIPGSYTVTAANVTSGVTSYTPAAPSQAHTVTSGGVSAVTVAFSGSASPPPPPPTSSLNLTIDGMHIQQVVQSYTGGVPLVAGRSGLLRVFVRANAANTVAPPVRVRLYNGSSLTSTITINAAVSSVPQSIAEGSLSSSWNYPLPASVIQPGLRVLADVDPANIVAESSDSDNTYPATGTPAALDVRVVPTFSLRLVPVLQSVNGMQGDVHAGNSASYLAATRAVYPLGGIDADVRAPFTTSAPVLQKTDANGAWNQVLSEINALRAADGSARYYYGVVKVGYSAGIAGLGYVPGRAAVGWDHLPSASGVMAHELGHNFGRFHAPGCGAGGPDPSYPYGDGAIGAYGYDAAANSLKSPTSTYDLMGYCSNTWISDYTYRAIMSYRSGSLYTAAAAVFASNQSRRGLLVWGRVQNGAVILEPTFEVDAPPSLPRAAGRNRLQAFGPLGETLFDLSFDGERIADHPDPSAQHFAFVVPLDGMRGVAPSRVRVAAAGRQAELVTPPTAAAAPAPVAERVDARTVRVRWNAGTTRGVLVRHPATGDILAFGRGGEALVHTTESSLDVTTSDGVHSARQRVGVSRSAPPSGRR